MASVVAYSFAAAGPPSTRASVFALPSFVGQVRLRLNLRRVKLSRQAAHGG
jgi:hypothetical protein